MNWFKDRKWWGEGGAAQGGGTPSDTLSVHGLQIYPWSARAILTSDLARSREELGDGVH